MAVDCRVACVMAVLAAASVQVGWLLQSHIPHPHAAMPAGGAWKESEDNPHSATGLATRVADFVHELGRTPPQELLGRVGAAETRVGEAVEELVAELRAVVDAPSVSATTGSHLAAHATAAHNIRLHAKAFDTMTPEQLVQQGWKFYRGSFGIDKNLRASCYMWAAATAQGSAAGPFLFVACGDSRLGIASRTVQTRHRLGENLYFGEGMEADWGLSTDFFFVSAARGYSSAMAKLGKRLWASADETDRRLGSGETSGLRVLGEVMLAADNAEAAAMMWEAGAHSGDSLSAVHLALAHARGVGVDKEPTLAVLLLGAAAEEGELTAVALLAARTPPVSLGDTPVPDTVQESWRHHIRARTQEEGRSMAIAEYNTGLTFAMGVAMLLPEPALAVHWLNRSALHGSALAQYKLGLLEIQTALGLESLHDAAAERGWGRTEVVRALDRSRWGAGDDGLARGHLVEALVCLGVAAGTGHTPAAHVAARLEQALLHAAPSALNASVPLLQARTQAVADTVELPETLE